MHNKRFHVPDAAPARTVAGTTVMLATGDARVGHAPDGYMIAVSDAPPIVVPPSEFDRLILSGHLHGVADE